MYRTVFDRALRWSLPALTATAWPWADRNSTQLSSKPGSQ